MIKGSRFACTAGALAGMLVLAACGGTSSNLTAPVVESKLHKAFGKVISSPVAVTTLVADNAPKFANVGDSERRIGIVSQSTDGVGNPSVTQDIVWTDLDEETNVEINVGHSGSPDVTHVELDSADDKHLSYALTRELSGYTARSFELIKEGNNGLSLAKVDVHWKSDDKTDYLAAGYWADFDGYKSGSGFTSGHVGAFVTGKEFVTAPDLPTSEKATYKGRSVGYYGYQFDRNGVNHKQVGDYVASAELNADFKAGTVNGCIGCGSGIWVTGAETTDSGSSADIQQH